MTQYIVVSFPWLGRRDLFQLFDEDLKCNVAEIRAVLNESKDD
jgi:hypothetical protein